MSMVSPKLEIRRLAVEYVSEGGMTIVARATEHGIATVDLAGEEDTIAIKWQECIL